MNMKETIRQIHNMIKESDPNLSQDDEAYKAAAVLLLSANIGPNQLAIARLLGYPRSLVAKFNYRLRKSKIWRRGKVYHSGWDDPEHGGIAFWLDVATATGLIERK